LRCYFISACGGTMGLFPAKAGKNFGGFFAILFLIV